MNALLSGTKPSKEHWVVFFPEAMESRDANKKLHMMTSRNKS